MEDYRNCLPDWYIAKPAPAIPFASFKLFIKTFISISRREE
jgi:hypothetical protein